MKLDFSNFKLKTVIDFLTVKASGKAGERRKTFHDLTSYAVVDAWIAEMKRKGFTRFDVEVLELSADFWPRESATKAEAEALLVNLVRFCPSPMHARSYNKKGASMTLTTPQLKRGVAAGKTTAIGHHRGHGTRKASPVAYRAYWKMRDKALTLPDDQHRARFEVTLRGEALPVTEWESFKRYSLAKYAHHLYTRQLKAGVELGSLLDTISPRIGKARTSIRRKFDQRTEANTTLNATIKRRLERLTDKLCRGSEAHSTAPAMQKTAPFSDPIPPVKPLPSKESGFQKPQSLTYMGYRYTDTSAEAVSNPIKSFDTKPLDVSSIGFTPSDIIPIGLVSVGFNGSGQFTIGREWLGRNSPPPRTRSPRGSGDPCIHTLEIFPYAKTCPYTNNTD